METLSELLKSLPIAWYLNEHIKTAKSAEPSSLGIAYSKVRKSWIAENPKNPDLRVLDGRIDEFVTDYLGDEFKKEDPGILEAALYLYVKELDKKPHLLRCGRSLSIQKTSANQTTHFSVWWHIVFLILTRD